MTCKRANTGLLLVFAVLIAAACNGRPSRTVTIDELLAADDFDSPGRWDQMTLPNIVLDVRDGVMHIEADSRIYAASLDYLMQTDVIIDVEARLLSEDDSNGFGIMCRAASAATGYYFMIGGDGSGTIRRGASGGVEALAAWTKTGAVVPGSARNRIRAVCVGDYLALYVNDEFVAEARDSLYSRGYTGLVAVTTRPNQRVEVSFDLLRIYAPGAPSVETPGESVQRLAGGWRWMMTPSPWPARTQPSAVTCVGLVSPSDRTAEAGHLATDN